MTAPAPPEPRVLFVSAASGLADDRGWVFSLRERYDVVHWHGGVDGLTEACARRMTAALEEVGKPLVLTLTGGEDGDVADGSVAALGVLVRYADAVIVDDPVAAATVRHRWQRDAVVIEHPDDDDPACAAVYESVVAPLD